VRRRGRRWPLLAAGELGFREGSGERRERERQGGEASGRRGGEWREPERRLGFRALREGEPVGHTCPPSQRLVGWANGSQAEGAQWANGYSRLGNRAAIGPGH
jgi:hypothetical protein